MALQLLYVLITNGKTVFFQSQRQIQLFLIVLSVVFCMMYLSYYFILIHTKLISESSLILLVHQFSSATLNLSMQNNRSVYEESQGMDAVVVLVWWISYKHLCRTLFVGFDPQHAVLCVDQVQIKTESEITLQAAILTVSFFTLIYVVNALNNFHYQYIIIG